MFDVSEGLVIYDDVGDLIKLVRHYLNTEDERRELSSKVQKRAYKEHKYKQRVIPLINIAFEIMT